MLNIKAFLQNLTTRPGVYQMLGDDGKILYIGKARNLKKRLSNYFSAKQKDIKTNVLLSHIKDIQVIVTHNENEALLLECNLIKKHTPHYNILFRDDKSFPYILISKDGPYPCIDFYRGYKKSKSKDLYFGPYPNVSAVRETLHLIQKIFGLRTCHDRYYAERIRPCLQYQIGLCSGACAGLISPEEYQEDVDNVILFLQGKNEKILIELQRNMEKAAENLEYEKASKLRNQITKIREIQSRQYISTKKGDVDVIGLSLSTIACIQLLSIRGGRILGSQAYFPVLPLDTTKEEILTSFITQHYLGLRTSENDLIPKEIILNATLSEKKLLEDTLSQLANHNVIIRVPFHGERKKWVEMAETSANESLASYMLNKMHMKERFDALQSIIPSMKKLSRIECFDVSHMMGEATVASCVVFNPAGPIKSAYRRFNIVNTTPGDDISALKQALFRRYQRLQKEQAILPDLLLIDGGLQQLNAAINTLLELNIHEILVMGVAKGVARKPGLETLHIHAQAPIHLSSDSAALHLIQQIRDEAHRFAITGHRQRRDKKRHSSVLESIPGVGPRRRRELLRYFGGIQALTRVSLEELEKVPGISRALAKRIFERLHDRA